VGGELSISHCDRNGGEKVKIKADCSRERIEPTEDSARGYPVGGQINRDARWEGDVGRETAGPWKRVNFCRGRLYRDAKRGGRARRPARRGNCKKHFALAEEGSGK